MTETVELRLEHGRQFTKLKACANFSMELVLFVLKTNVNYMKSLSGASVFESTN